MVALSAQEELVLLRKRARRRLVGAVVLVLVSVSVLLKVVGSMPDQQMQPELVEISSGSSVHDGAKLGASYPQGIASESPLAPLTTESDAKPALNTDLPASLATVSPDASVVAIPPLKAASPVVPLPSASTPPSPSTPTLPVAQPDANPSHPAKSRTPDPAAILEDRVVDRSVVLTDKPVAESKVMIQLAALSDTAKADALRERLESIGVSAKFTRFSRVVTSKGPVTRVRLGPFAARQEAEVVLKKLARVGVSGMIVSQ